MKKIIAAASVFVVLLILTFLFFRIDAQKNLRNIPVVNTRPSTQPTSSEEDPTALANPASVNCEEIGGSLEIVTNPDGSQFGMCDFGDYSCEEWALLRGECDIVSDQEKIKEKLIEKGLNLTDMKVVIKKHLGKYIEGMVVPVSAPAGGGYVFAVKEGSEIKVLADGNGAILCSAFDDYPDFPTYLISECVDQTGNPVER